MVFQQNLLKKSYFIAKMSGQVGQFWLLESALRYRRSCFQLMLWMNKQKTIKKLFLENFYSKTNTFTIKSNSRNTDWIVDLFPQVKSAEHMAKINT